MFSIPQDWEDLSVTQNKLGQSEPAPCMCCVGRNLCWNVCWSYLAQGPQSFNGWKRFPLDICDRWKPLQVHQLWWGYGEEISETKWRVQRMHAWSEAENLTANLMGNNGRNNCPAVCLGDTGAGMTDKVKVKPHYAQKSHSRKYK